MINRVSFTVLPAMVVTILLFYIMFLLIQSDGVELDEREIINLVDYVRVPEPPELRVDPRTVERPEPPQPPPQVPEVSFNPGKDPILVWEPAPPRQPRTNGGPMLSDGAYLPIVKVQPNYPRRALQNGQQGWVVLQFTVDELGRVVSPEVLETCVTTLSVSIEDCTDSPGSIFNHAATTAAMRFKYKPRIVDGFAVPTSDVRHRISFQLTP
jgi:periplasmic protein TonB